MEEGFSFVWEAGKAPYMRTPDGRVIHLSVDGNIPYLVDDPNEKVVLPAVGGELEAPPPPNAIDEEGGRRDLKLLANSVPHLLTHFPKNPWCDSCKRAKLIRKACPNRDAELPPTAVFGD